jgi:LCP family protein required for cell wall assembly
VSEEKKKRKGTWKKVLLIIFLSLLLLSLLTVAGVGIYLNHLLDQVTPYDPSNDVTIPQEEADKLIDEDEEVVPVEPEGEEELPNIEDLTIPTETEPPVVIDPVNWDNVINIMLIGQDRRPGQGRQRSDSMILLTVNKSKGTITLTSFMRDQYVRIPGYKNNKMNAAYAFGGMKLLNATVEENFGVKVDGDIEVDFNNFRKVIDKLGGVDIKLSKKEANYINSCCDGTVSAGTNRLNGEQALIYARIRSIDSDYRRAERQRTVISSLINRYKSLSLTEMLAMVEDLLPLVTTNMSKNEIIDIAVEVAPMLAGAQMNTMRIPVDGTFRQGTVRVRAGLAAWFQYDIDFEANRKVLRDLFMEE